LGHSKSRIYLVASSGRTVGASTIALNLAQQLSKSEGSTLLLDCNSWSPYLARHLSINGLSRKIAITSFGFSAAEIHTRESLTQLAASLSGYQRIVIDYGQLHNPIATANGRRTHEEIFTWAIHAQSSLLLISRNDPTSLDEASRTMEEIKQVTPTLKRHLLLTLTSVLSRKERARLVENSAARFGMSCSLISRDRRSVVEMEEKGSTFSEVAPRSMVLGELRELIEELS
jgi:adenylylsulfate kinase-like enzyme